jgi:PKD repeat protein
MNNPPEVDILGILPSQIFRTESALIYAEGSDVEDLPSDIIPTFQYKPSSSSNWDDLSDWSYNSGRFEASFTTSETEEVGGYDFRVKIWDSDGDDSGWYYQNESLEVQNNIPFVLNLTLSSSEIYRGEDVYLHSNAEDGDMDEDDLAPFFEYSLDGETWETLFFGNPKYTNGQWEIVFSPQIIADLGEYSFRVRYSDIVTHSGWKYENNTLEVKNNIPSVEIETSGYQDGASVAFSATVSDSEDSTSSLTFLWNFGDGSTSSEQNPMYTYEESGPYTVTLTVTDSEGAEAFNTTSIEVDVGDTGSEPDGDVEEGFPLWILLLLIVIIIVVLLLFIILTRKKKPKGEEIWQPETEVQAPYVAPQIEQQYVVPPPSPPQEVIPSPSTSVVPSPPPPPPPVLPAESQGMITKNIKCPKCGQAFQVNLNKGENTIKCPHCGVSGKVKL